MRGMAPTGVRLIACNGGFMRWPRHGISQPEHEDGGEGEGGEEDLRAPAVAGRDAAPVLETGEAVLDAVSAPATVGVARDRGLASAP